jgi:cold-inducible RNA-binding protein
MGSKLYVGNLAWGVTNESLKEAFVNFGTIREATVITDRETGQSRGFGFVTFEAEADASTAINAMDGTSLGGRNLRVNAAEEKPRGGGGGGGYRGGGGGGGYSSDRGGYSSDRGSYAGDRGGYSNDRGGNNDRGGGRGNRGRDW